MTGRHAIRGLLASAGLLDAAREARDAASSVGWWRDNSDFWMHGAPDRLPVPPLRLVRSSTGTSSLRWLFEGGRLAAGSIAGILAKNGVELRRLGSLLDFGCGCGRVIRQWAGLGPALHGSDYNRAAIAWCQRHLPCASFTVNGLSPPLPYHDGQFDFVYALSVFTHLPEPLLVSWLSEMRRVLKAGGWLVLSTHGESYLGELNPDEQMHFRAGRLVVKFADDAGTNRCGVYASEAYIRRRCSDGFRVVDFVPQGAKGNPVQDLVLLQKL
jgi:SAM-dependent methyltransferase